MPACEGPGGGSRSKDRRCDLEPSWDGASGAVRTRAVAALGALASPSPRAGTPGRACVHCPSCGWRRTSLVPWGGSPTVRALNPSDEAAARTAGALAGCLPPPAASPAPRRSACLHRRTSSLHLGQTSEPWEHALPCARLGAEPWWQGVTGGHLHGVASTSLLSTVSAVSQLCRDDNKN